MMLFLSAAAATTTLDKGKLSKRNKALLASHPEASLPSKSPTRKQSPADQQKLNKSTPLKGMEVQHDTAKS